MPTNNLYSTHSFSAWRARRFSNPMESHFLSIDLSSVAVVGSMLRIVRYSTRSASGNARNKRRELNSCFKKFMKQRWLKTFDLGACLFQYNPFPFRLRNGLKASPPFPRNSFVTYAMNLRSPSLLRGPLVLNSRIILSNFPFSLGPVLKSLKLYDDN